MFGQWLTSLSLQVHSARTHGGHVHPLANVQVLGGHQPLFLSDTPAYSWNGTQPHQCEAFYPEEADLHLPVHELIKRSDCKGVGLTISRQFLLQMSCCNEV